MYQKLKLAALLLICCANVTDSQAAGTKLSQINNGGALQPSNDKLVAVRNGTTDELVNSSTIFGQYLPLAGGTMTGPIDMGASFIDDIGAIKDAGGTYSIEPNTRHLDDETGTTNIIYNTDFGAQSLYVQQGSNDSAITVLGRLGAVDPSFTFNALLATDIYAAEFDDNNNTVTLADSTHAMQVTGWSTFSNVDNVTGYIYTADLLYPSTSFAAQFTATNTGSDTLTIGFGDIDNFIAGLFNNSASGQNVNLATLNYSVDAAGTINAAYYASPNFRTGALIGSGPNLSDAFLSVDFSGDMYFNNAFGWIGDTSNLASVFPALRQLGDENGNPNITWATNSGSATLTIAGGANSVDVSLTDNSSNAITIGANQTSVPALTISNPNFNLDGAQTLNLFDTADNSLIHLTGGGGTIGIDSALPINATSYEVGGTPGATGTDSVGTVFNHGIATTVGSTAVLNGSAGTPTCGSGCASIRSGSTNLRGSAVTGTLATTVVVNFSTTLPSIPYCVVADSSASTAIAYTATTSALTVTFSTGLTAATLTWNCPL